MPTAAAPSPTAADDSNPATNAIIQSVQRGDGSAAGIADPIELFANDYDANHGRVASILVSGGKRPASLCRTAPLTVSSPVRKRVNVAMSPARRAAGAVAAVAANLSHVVDPNASNTMMPPIIAGGIRRRRPR